VSFERGRTLYRLTRFVEALEAFSKAYEELPEPAFLFNIAQCLRQLGRDDEAAQAYEQFLGVARPDDPARPEIEQDIIELRAKVAAHARESEELHRISEERELELARIARIQAERSRPLRFSASHARALTISGGVIGGLGLCGLVAGIATGVEADQARDSLVSATNSGGTYEPSVGQSWERNRSLAIGFLAVGGALTAVGSGLLARGLWERQVLKRRSQ
jgi:tetratricopeptide (TPR) repeat protein